MTWVPAKYAVSFSDDKPRALTQAEILDIVTSLPKIQGIDKAATKLSTDQTKAKLARSLSLIELAPSGLPALKRIIQLEYQKSLIQSGSAVGQHAAEAVGGPASQSALKSFHVAGQAANLGTVADNIAQLMRGVKVRDVDGCTVHFLDVNLSYDAVFRKRSEFIQVDVRRLVKDVSLVNLDNEPKDSFWWFESFTDITDKKRLKGKKALLIHVDVNEMYAMRVEMSQLARAIEIDSPPSVRCVYSPLKIGKIYVLPDREKISEEVKKKNPDVISEDAIPDIFLIQIVKEKMLDIRVSGITGVVAYYPVILDILNLIGAEKRANKVNKEDWSNLPTKLSSRDWIISLKTELIVTKNLKPSRLIKLFEAVGINIITRELKKVELIPLDYSKFNPNYQPRTWLVTMPVVAEDKSPKDYLQELKANNPKIAKLTEYVHAVTEGSEYDAILTRDDIDPEVTISNNPHYILQRFGVEAARTVYLNELDGTIKRTGSTLDTRHLRHFADYLFRPGFFTNVTYTGHQFQEAGFLTEAATERVMKSFSSSALQGQKVSARSTIAAVALGVKPDVGTGTVQIIPIKLENSDFEELRSDEPTALEDISEMKLIPSTSVTDASLYGTPSVPKYFPVQVGVATAKEDDTGILTDVSLVDLQSKGTLTAEAKAELKEIAADEAPPTVPVIVTKAMFGSLKAAQDMFSPKPGVALDTRLEKKLFS